MIKPFTAPEKLPEITAADLDNIEPINGDQLLTQITEFIGRYLQCTDHQRTVLALWALHTHCLPAAQVTPYLAIQSAEKQSGKTLCLQLLNLLCADSALTAGFTANTLTRRIDGPISTVLLDECQATVGTRNRSKGPTLRAILSSGFHCGPGYTDAKHERNAFAPKAFAGMGQLPEALADRSIPIILKPIKNLGPQAPPPAKSSSGNRTVQRFDLRRAIQEAKPLEEQLRFWAEDSCPDLEEKPVYATEDFPPGLSPRRQDIIEPLLLLADHIGSVWPTRIREALNAVFLQEAAFNLAQSLQLLADIRDCFAWYGYPARLSSAALLSWMQTRPSRPWDGEGAISARIIAQLLTPFDICPRVQRIGEEDPARGYRLEDFLPHWKTYLAFDPAVVTHNRKPEVAVKPDAADLRAASAAPEPEKSESVRKLAGGLERSDINNDAGCNAVTDTRSVSSSPVSEQVEVSSSTQRSNSPSTPASLPEARRNGSSSSAPAIGVKPDAADLRAASAAPEPEKSESVRKLAGGLERSDINNDAACNAVTDSREVSGSTEQTEKFAHASPFPIPEATGNGSHSTFQQGPG